MREIKRLIVDFENNRVVFELKEDHTPPLAYTPKSNLPDAEKFVDLFNVGPRHQQFLDWSRGKLQGSFKRENISLSLSFSNSYQHHFTKQGFDIKTVHVFDKVTALDFKIEPEIKAK